MHRHLYCFACIGIYIMFLTKHGKEEFYAGLYRKILIAVYYGVNLIRASKT